MKKWLKNWWFSILMFVCAVSITLWVVIGCFVFANDDFIYTLLIINSISPVLLLIIIGNANTPKEKDND